ncbi:capsule-associated protein CAP1 [Acarospora aff. strigata]|nr:capsule-associated protein CAP1 [Acarospora aff. strigata]
MYASQVGFGRGLTLAGGTREEDHVSPNKPLPATDLTSHPISQLIAEARTQFEGLQARQSKSLAEAVAEYRRRYGIPPPPNFDVWYEFAKNRGVQLIDEYDNIYDSLLPFWALEPSVIRQRTRESLGFDNSLIGLLIRDGEAVKIENGAEWQQKATLGMIGEFVQYLPDMDIAFNIHDEPRVMVAHEDLARLVTRAKEKSLPAAYANPSPRNSWSRRPKDLGNGRHLAEVKTTRFNTFAHQPTWTHSRLSCSPDSPARSLDEHAADNITSYSVGDLGFIYNKTALSDICMSPSLKETYGFFDRPNAFSIVHDLFPIFSQSKLSSFQDILYPSPWYWYGKVTYQESQDVPWSAKNDALYWRGSTTGGFSRDGGWRRQHRQRCVQKMNALDTAKTLTLPNNDVDDSANPSWQVHEVKKPDYASLFDVKFTYIGQCDPGDCDAQREFFQVVDPAPPSEAWGFKFLLDIDGNAFSGRFYAFLKSWSLVSKIAIFREWHEEWLVPWLHYVPLGFGGQEYVETMRWFLQEEQGKKEAEELAVKGREWASKVLRKEDFEVWFFRLLLE